jgi:phenylalanyl-tRNA synthetase beta subunit
VTLQQAVDRFSESVVELAGGTLSESQMRRLFWLDKENDRKIFRLKLGQLNNLLGVALETDSPAVVINWLKYQMGRRETKRGWGDSGLGQQVVDDIETLREDAQQIARDVFGENHTSLDLRKAHIALVRRYAGYLKRWYVARGGQQ